MKIHTQVKIAKVGDFWLANVLGNCKTFQTWGESVAWVETRLEANSLLPRRITVVQDGPNAGQA